MKGNLFKEIKQSDTECRTCEKNCPNQVFAGVSCAHAVAIAQGTGKDANQSCEYSKPVPDNLLSAHIMNFKLLCLSGARFVMEPVLNNSSSASCCG